MSLQAFVTTSDPDKAETLKVGDTEILKTLGDDEETLSVQLKELFEAVSEAVTPTIKSESQLTVEVSGEITLKASGGAKFLFFNIGGEAGSTGAMKVTLNTTLKPA